MTISCLNKFLNNFNGRKERKRKIVVVSPQKPTGEICSASNEGGRGGNGGRIDGYNIVEKKPK